MNSFVVADLFKAAACEWRQPNTRKVVWRKLGEALAIECVLEMLKCECDIQNLRI